MVKKKYTDVFKKPVNATEVELAVTVAIDRQTVSASLLQRQLRIGYGKAATLINLLEDAHVVSKGDSTKPRTIILPNRDEAINAALRQLRKGNG